MGGPCRVPFCGVDVLLSERPCARLREASSSRSGALRSGCGNDVWDVLIKPSLASLSRLSRLSRCRSACLSACRLRTASAIFSVISSSCVVPMSFRSTPSASSSSSTCLTRSSSTSSAPRSDALSSERRLAWCSMVLLGGTTDLLGELLRLVTRLSLSSRLLLDSLLPSRLRSCLLLSLGGSRLLLLLLGMPTSLKLSRCTSSRILRSSSSSAPPTRRSLGKTLSPGLYFSLSAFFSSSFFPLPGFAFRNMSSSVVTVAFGWVERTEARHEGHVYGWIDVAADAWKANHSFRQAPQKV